MYLLSLTGEQESRALQSERTVMCRKIALLPIILMLVAPAGCSDDDPAAPAPPREEVRLAIYSYEFLAGSRGIHTDPATFWIEYPGGAARLPDVDLVNGTMGTTVEFDRATAGTRAFFDKLINGVDETTVSNVEFIVGGTMFRTLLESDLIDGGVSGTLSPDLDGTTVKKAVVHVDSVWYESPGEDPNRDGDWTDFHYYFRLEFIGYL